MDLLLAEPGTLGTYFVLAMVAIFTIVWIGLMMFMIRSYLKAAPDQAIIRTGFGGTMVALDGIVSIPILHNTYLVELSTKTLPYQRAGDLALRLGCGTRAELQADLMVRLNRDQSDIAKVVRVLGVDRINSAKSLNEHFSPKFNDVLESIAGKCKFEEFVADKDAFREQIALQIGSDLSGMVLEDICLHHLKKV